MSIIKIRGKGKVKVKPDIIEFSINFNTINAKYDTAINNEIENVNKFLKILEENNINKEEFKTINYSVNPYYEYRKTGIVEKKEERVFVGYQVTRRGKLEIKLDLKLMEKIVYELEKLGIKSTYNFTVKDKETAKKEAMKEAYNNALEKAKLLAEVSGMELDGYEEINYDVPINYATYSETRHAKTCSIDKEMSIASFADTFNIEDITIEENIYVVWKVK